MAQGKGADRAHDERRAAVGAGALPTRRRPTCTGGRPLRRYLGGAARCAAV